MTGSDLNPAELAFLHFHAREPLPHGWEFRSGNRIGGVATFRATKILASGQVVCCDVPVTSFSRVKAYFTDDYRLKAKGRALALWGGSHGED